MQKNDDEISEDLFNALCKVVKKIFNEVSFNICYEEVEDRLMDLIYKFIKDYKINSLSVNSNTDINSNDEFDIFLKEKNITWNKLQGNQKI